MRSTVFVRPNVKLFLLGALLLAVAHDYFAQGHSQGSIFSTPTPPLTRHISETELSLLLEQAGARPRPELLMRISQAYEDRGDIRNAMFYLQRAEQLAELQDQSL